MTSPEQDRFTLLVQEHQGAVFRTLARLVGHADRLEDLAQEVFIRLWRGMPNFRGEAHVKTYLYRIVVNVARDEWKRRRRIGYQEPIDDPERGWGNRLRSTDPGADDVLVHSAIQAEILDALRSLNPIERGALVLFHQEELSYQEVANALNLPLNTVRTHLRRGRERLASAVKERIGSDEL